METNLEKKLVDECGLNIDTAKHVVNVVADHISELIQEEKSSVEVHRAKEPISSNELECQENHKSGILTGMRMCMKIVSELE